MNNALVWGISGMIRIVLGLLLLLANLVYIRNFWTSWSGLPLTSLFWSAIFGTGLFIRQGKMADFIWVLLGVSALAMISGGLIMEHSAVKILFVQLIFGFFSGTVVGAGVLEFKLHEKTDYSSWFNIGSVITGVGCLSLIVLALMDYAFDSKFLPFFDPHAMKLGISTNVMVSTGVIISIFFSAAIGFLFSYGLQFSLFAMLFLLSGVALSLSFQGISFDLFFASLGIVLAFVLGSSIGIGVKRIGELAEKKGFFK